MVLSICKISWLLLFCHFSTYSLAAEISAPPPKLGDPEDQIISSSVGHELHDAIIAAGLHPGSQTPLFTLSEMQDLFKCSGYLTEQQEQQFLQEIPNIIDKAFVKAPVDKARILELTRETFHVGENYQTNIKAATIACFVTRDRDDVNQTYGPAAYASYIAASTDNANPTIDPTAYNLSMLIEADVMELPAEGAYYIPKTYCFDLEDKNDKGFLFEHQNHDTLPTYTGAQNQRSIALGNNQQAMLQSTVNRVTRISTWSTDGDKDDIFLTMNLSDWDRGLIKSAYHTPRAELLAMIDWLNQRLCDHAAVNGTYAEFWECLYFSSQPVLEQWGLSTDFMGVLEAWLTVRVQIFFVI